MFLFSVAILLEFTVVFFEGSAEPFGLTPFLLLYALLLLFFVFGAAVFFLRKKRLFSIIFIALFFQLAFFGLNQNSFEWVDLPMAQAVRGNLPIARENVALLNHKILDTPLLKDYEEATFSVGNERRVATLNHPLQLQDDVKVVLSGDGTHLLITRSPWLSHLLFSSISLIAALFVFAVRRGK